MNCFCKNLAHYELCSGCVERRYLINFKVKKICLFEISEYAEKEIMKFDFYFFFKKSEAFFYFQSNVVKSSLDNPYYEL